MHLTWRATKRFLPLSQRERIEGEDLIRRALRARFKVLKNQGRGISRAVYVGDSRVDREAAESAGMNFIGVGNRIEHHRMIATIADLPAVLELLNANRE